jgi:hypothetical protein
MDDPHPEHPSAPEEIAIERDVLDLLVAADGARHWSIEEIALEIGSELKVRDAVAGLHRAGLAHRTSDDFVFATRAAIRSNELRM